MNKETSYEKKVIIIIAALCLALVCGGVLFYNIRKSDSALGDDTQNEDLVIAELKIRENGSLICDKKINFVKKATDAIEDVLKQTTK